MERANLVAELLRDIDHLRHLVRAIAVIVHEYVPAQHFRQRFQSEIARRGIALVRRVPCVPLATICFGLYPCGPIAGYVAHARRWPALLIDTLGILAASHLQTILRAGK